MRALVAAAILLLGAAAVRAAEPKKEEAPAKAPAGADAKKPAASPAKGDPSGTWTWTFNAPDGRSMERTVTLKREGDKLSGSSQGRNGESPIQDGTFKNGELSFTVVREREGRKMTAKFHGKMEGDKIKGTMTQDRGEGERTSPWEAKRK